MNQKFALGLAAVLTAFFVVAISTITVMIIAAPLAQPPQVQTQSAVTSAVTSNEKVATTIAAQLKPESAAQIALTAVPGSKLVRTPELVNFQGTVAYEVLLDRGTLYIDATTGAVLENNVANNSVINRSNARPPEEHKKNEKEGDHD